MNQDMNELIRRPRKGSLRLVSENGRGRIVAVETEDAGDGTETSQRVVDGSADGGKGRQDPPEPTGMNKLIRDLAYGAAVRSARQSG
jgi:hypothetical protein